MLDVRSISRSFGDFKAVDAVSFSVHRGEVVGLLGHNGAGKTTIMKMLSSYLEPDEGNILFNGAPIGRDKRQLQRELGYLPENLPLYPELSVASYLDYAAELKGLKGSLKRLAIRQVVEVTELGSRLLSPISTLSRGMKQRVGVGQAILGQPSLLILDEPTNGLDPTQTEQMRALIRAISESATVILSTHIMQEVEAVCDRALIVRHGRLAVDASLAELTRGRRIRLSCDTDVESLRQILSPLDCVIGVSGGSGGDGEGQAPAGPAQSSATDCLLQITETTEPGSAVAGIVERLVGAGVRVYAIQPDVRDLQTLFLEVNRSDAPGTAVAGGGQSVRSDRPGSLSAGEVGHVA